MRIISGIYKGRKISPPSNLNSRPTTDRAKEALFSIINSRYFFTGKTVLDLFSGTGNIALEFISRGVEKVIAVDNHINCIDFINSTAKKFNIDISVVKSDALKYIQNCNMKFNFIFVDPPYNYAEYQQIKDTIIQKKLIKKDGLLIIEHDKKTVFDEFNVEVRKYGTVHFSIFSF